MESRHLLAHQAVTHQKYPPRNLTKPTLISQSSAPNCRIVARTYIRRPRTTVDNMQNTIATVTMQAATPVGVAACHAAAMLGFREPSRQSSFRSHRGFYEGADMTDHFLGDRDGRSDEIDVVLSGSGSKSKADRRRGPPALWHTGGAAHGGRPVLFSGVKSVCSKPGPCTEYLGGLDPEMRLQKDSF